MSLEVTFSRDGDDLVITDHPDNGDGMWVTEDGITWPSFTMRRTYAPDSKDIGGRVLTAVVPDAGQTSLVVKLKGATPAALIALMDELEAATSQFTYTLTVAIDGVSRSWAADSELPQWGNFDSGQWKARMTTATITIPLNPPGSV